MEVIMLGIIIKGTYRIEAKLGAGGMADVYKATRLSDGETVAIKVLPDALARDAEMVKRFHREIQLALPLQHPNIVEVFEDGEENGIDYFVMEYVDGEDLSEIIKREGMFSPPQAIALIRQVCEALGYAHDRGVTHRDMKPENIMLTRTGEVKLTDFGIAKAADGTRLTKAGTAFGSPEYMSPEQCQGDPNLDHRSDIYSLGIVLYQMLTGGVPFTGTIGTVVDGHLRHIPTPPSLKNPDVSEWIDDIILTCLEKDPQHRYQNASDMRYALSIGEHPAPSPVGETVNAVSSLRSSPNPDEIGQPSDADFIGEKEEDMNQVSVTPQNGQTVTPPPTQTATPPPSQNGDSPKGLSLRGTIPLQILALALIAGICVMVWQYRKGLNENLLQEKISEHLSAGQTFYAEEGYEECAKEMKAVLDLDPSHAEAQQYIGKVEKQLRIETNFVAGMRAFNEGRYSQSIEEMDKVLKDRPGHALAKKQKKTAEKLIQIQGEDSNSQTAKEWLEKGDAVLAKPHEALIYYQKALEASPELNQQAYARLRLGDMYASLGRRTEAFDEYQKAIDLDNEYPWAYSGIGYLHLQEGKYHDAIEQFKKAKQIEREFYQKVTDGQIHLGSGYATCYAKLPEALAEYQQAEEINDENPYLYYARGTTYLEFDRYDDAIKEFERAIELSPEYLSAHLAIGGAHYEAQAYDKAIEKYQSILEIDPEHIDAYRLLGAAYSEKEEYDSALKAYEKAYELNPMDSSALNGLAYFYAERGTNLYKAERLLKQAIEMMPTHRKYFADSLGWVYYRLGRYQEAHELVKESIRLMHPHEKRILADTYYHLGMIQSKMGLVSLAKTSLNKAVELKPTSASGKSARRALGTL
jgi:serine/threonine protein kinase/tetratricopeptide (TPR) repeat protein